MLRTILASAVIAAMASGAAAQYLPSGAGLTPGAPLAKDPVTGDPEVVGENGVITDDFQMQGRIPAERRAAEIPGFVGQTEPHATFSPPSGAGLTPGTPTGENWLGSKTVAD